MVRADEVRAGDLININGRGVEVEAVVFSGDVTLIQVEGRVVIHHLPDELVEVVRAEVWKAGEEGDYGDDG